LLENRECIFSVLIKDKEERREDFKWGRRERWEKGEKSEKRK